MLFQLFVQNVSVVWSDFIHEFLIYIFAIKIFLIRTKKKLKAEKPSE